jgi:hypothetical protein
MTAILGLLNIVPSWLWALMLAGSLATGCVEQHKLSTTRLELQTLKTAVEHQKAEAAQKLAELTAEAAAKDKRAHESWISGELQNVENQKTVADLGDKLRAVRLRDPAGRGPGCGSPQADGAPVPAPGAGNAPEASGLLSDAASDFLRTAARESDQINAAYIACRQHIQTLSELLK